MTATDTQASPLSDAIESIRLHLRCPDFPASLRFYTEVLGLRVAMIMPADDPELAALDGHGISLLLERDDALSAELAPALTLSLSADYSRLPAPPPTELIAPEGTRIRLLDSAAEAVLPEPKPSLTICRAAEQAWVEGRAGMRYRDLIPGRWGGRYVASHIRIDSAGPVPDYVHYHHVRFQMIYCRAGWVRVVYEDQGPPFVLNAGDCVLQPPQIRHRVLESSAELEVIEIGCPAIHATHADAQLALPNGQLNPGRQYSDQRFVRHRAAQAQWLALDQVVQMRDTGIATATNGLATAQVLRVAGTQAQAQIELGHSGDFQFIYALEGSGQLVTEDSAMLDLARDDAVCLPPDQPYRLIAEPGSQWLQVML